MYSGTICRPQDKGGEEEGEGEGERGASNDSQLSCGCAYTGCL